MYSQVFSQHQLDNLLSLLRETSLELLSIEPTDTLTRTLNTTLHLRVITATAIVTADFYMSVLLNYLLESLRPARCILGLRELESRAQ